MSVPVIAVPTSIGYGASFGGVAALLGMLNSCASNVTVVNIDNGFGAGFVASLINRKWQEQLQEQADGRSGQRWDRGRPARKRAKGANLVRIET